MGNVSCMGNCFPVWETFPKWEIVSHMGNRILGRVSRMGNDCPDGQRGSDCSFGSEIGYLLGKKGNQKMN